MATRREICETLSTLDAAGVCESPAQAMADAAFLHDDTECAGLASLLAFAQALSGQGCSERAARFEVRAHVA